MDEELRELESTKALSAFYIERYFRDRLKEINSHPLTEENLVINQVEYEQLVNVAMGEEEGPFSVLTCQDDRPGLELGFSIQFYADAVVINIEYLGAIFAPYHSIASSDQEVANQLICFAQMISNGQILCSLTERAGRRCAAELFYQEGASSRAFLTWARYPWWWVDLGASGEYSVNIKKNSLLNEEIDPKKVLSEEFFILTRSEVNAEQGPGRCMADSVYLPLTKRVHELLVQDNLFKGTGKHAGENEYTLFYRSWEFWVGMSAFAGVLYWLVYMKVIPASIARIPQLTWPISIFLIYSLLIPLLKFKEQLRESDPMHPYIRLDTFIRTNGSGVIAAGIYLLLFLLSFAPLYLLYGTQNFISLFVLTQLFSVAWLPIIGFAFAMVVSLSASKKARILSAVVGMGSIAGIFGVQSLTDTGPESPEPYTMLIVLATMAAPIASLLRLRGIRQRKQEAEQSKTVRLDRRYQRAMWIELIAWHGAAGALLFAAWKFSTGLKSEMLVFGTPVLMVSYLCIVAVSALAIMYAIRRGAIPVSWSIWLASLLFILFIAFPVFLIKDETNEGPGSAYLAQFIGAFLLGLSTAFRHGAQKIKADQEIRLEGALETYRDMGQEFDLADFDYHDFFTLPLDEFRGKSKKSPADFELLLEEASKAEAIYMTWPNQAQFNAVLARVDVRKLIVRYGKVADLSALETQVNLEEIELDCNHAATELWDTSCNPQLTRLEVKDFSKLQDVSGLSGAKKLEVLSLCGGPQNKLELISLEPLKALTNLHFLRLSNLSVEIDGLRSLAL